MYPVRIRDGTSPAVTAIGQFFWLIGHSFLRHLINAVEGNSSISWKVQHEKEEYPPTVATQLQAPRNSTNQQGERANTPPCRWLSVFSCEAQASKMLELCSKYKSTCCSMSSACDLGEWCNPLCYKAETPEPIEDWGKPNPLNNPAVFMACLMASVSGDA